MDKSWDKLFNGDFGFNPIIANKIARENGHEFPLEKDTFRFADIPINDIKCVIVGMEPYASWFLNEKQEVIPQATGRSFEVKELEGKTWQHKFKQASLRNIVKCIMYCETNEQVNSETFREKIREKEFEMVNPDEWFENLSNQGVCFLNAALTVKKDVPGTGIEYWKDFGKAFCNAIKEKNKNVVWFLFGKDAQNTFLEYLNGEHVVCTPHPRMASFSKEKWFNHCEFVDWKGKKG